MQVAALSTLVTIAGGPEAGLLGSAWVIVLRALSQLDLLQTVLTRRALDKKAAEVRESLRLALRKVAVGTHGASSLQGFFAASRAQHTDSHQRCQIIRRRCCNGSRVLCSAEMVVQADADGASDSICLRSR